MASFDPDQEAPLDLRAPAYLPDVHRLLPQSPDAEMGVLCAFLLCPNEVGEICSSSGVTPRSFYTPAHSIIFDLLMELRRGKQAIDFITLTQQLRNRDQLNMVGGASFITELFTFIPTAANARYYIDILQEKWKLREIITGCTDLASRSYDEQDNLAGIMDEAQGLLVRLTAEPRSDAGEKTMMENILEVQDRMEAIASNQQPSGLMTGLEDLDEELCGLHNGEVVVVSGTTGGGKSSLVHNIADHVGVDLNLPVMIFSYEMVRLWVTSRLIAARARINTKVMRSGKFNIDDATRYHRAVAELKDAKIFIEDNADMSVQQIRARARRRMSKSGLSLIIIDYIQKVRSETTKKNNSRQRDVAEVSDQVQKMAMELDVPVIALAQINKSHGEVREADDIVFDAKTVLKIRQDVVIPVEEEPDFVKRIIAIVKNNNGPLGNIPVTFQKPFVKFVNYVPEPKK